jgi:hypothetical protein
VNPKEEKMTNILTDDVQAYVREMISKEFGFVKKEEKAHCENRTLTNSENHNQKKEEADFGQGNSHFGY